MVNDGNARSENQPANEPTLRKRVMVVDDDELIRSSMEVLLQIMNCEVCLANSGEAALEILQGGAQMDFIILDMNMPGMGGAAALPRLRERCPNTPVLLATGRADQAAMELAANFSSVSILPKPFGLNELREAFKGFGQD